MTRALADLKAYWPVWVVYLVLGAIRLARPLDVAEAIYLTRSQIPVGDLFLFPYSPAYLALLHLWNGLGDSAAWLRSLGLVVGLAGLVLAPRVLRGLGGVHAEPGALWLLAASPFFII